MQPDVQENRFGILKAAYESFNRGDMAAAVVAVDPNVEWIEPAEFPGGGRTISRSERRDGVSGQLAGRMGRGPK